MLRMQCILSSVIPSWRLLESQWFPSRCYFSRSLFYCSVWSHVMLPVQYKFSVVSSIMTITTLTFIPTRLLHFNFIILPQCLNHVMLPVQYTFSLVSSIMTIAKITFIHKRLLLFEFIILLQCLRFRYAGMVWDGEIDKKILLTLQLYSNCYVKQTR